MKPATILVAAVGLASLAACASAPQTPDQLIVGKWNCSAKTPDGKISGPMTYQADGTTAFVLTFDSVIQDTSVIIVAEGSSIWEIPAEGKIREAIKSIDVRSAKMGGKDIPPSMLGDIEKTMIDTELSESSLEISRTDMVLVDKEGTRTVCKR